MVLKIFGTALLAVFTSLVLIVVTWRRNIKRRNLPPGPPPLPFLGTMLYVNNREMPQSLIQLKETYGSVFTIYLSNTPVVVLLGYDCVKEAFLDHGDVFSMRGRSDLGEMLFKGYGLILSNGDRWRQLRAFSLFILRNYGIGKKTLEERVQEEARYLTEGIRKQGGNIFDPTLLLSLAVFNVLCSIVFGDRFDYEDGKFKTFFALVTETMTLLSSPWGMLLSLFPRVIRFVAGPHQKIFRNVAKLRTFIVECVENHKVTLDPRCPRDLIDGFLIKMEEEKDNPGTEFHFENLFSMIIDLFFAATDTTITTLRFGILYLLKYPKVERKLHVEIDNVIGYNQCPSVEDRNKMPYTDAVIHEIQRSADILPLGFSRSTTQDLMFRRFHIPKGTIIFPVLTSVLKDPKYFKNPYTFDPTNFLNDDGSFKKIDAFLPFSLGERTCIGESLARMQLFLFFTNILQNFNLKSVVDKEYVDITSEPSGNMSVPKPYQMFVTPT